MHAPRLMLTTQNINPNERPPHRFFLVRWIVGTWHWILPPSLAHRDRESDLKRKLRATAIISLCIAAIIAALNYAKPLQDMWQERQARNYVERAKQFAESKDYVMAITTAQEAVRVAPDYEPGVRLNAQLLTAIGRSEALVYWGLLERQGSASVDDLKGKVRALLRIGRPREARDLLMTLLADHPDDKDLPLLAEEVLGRQGANTVLLDLLKRHNASNPEDRDNALRLATAQLMSRQETEMKLARESLWKLSEGEDGVSHHSLRVLAQLETLDLDERRRLSVALDTHTLADGEDHCAALAMRIMLAQDRRGSLIDECIERWFKGKGGKELLPLVRWLVLNGEAARIISLVDKDRIKTRNEDKEILQNYLNALSMLGRYTELAELIRDENVPLSRGERTYYEAHLSSCIIFARPDNLSKLARGARAGDLLSVTESDDLKQKFNAAVFALINEGRWDLLMALGEHLSANVKSFYDIAEQAFRAVASAGNARLERRAVAGWMASSRLAGNTNNLITAARRGALRWPDDPLFAEELLYCDFLQGNRIESSLPRANVLLQGSPNDSKRKLISALGFWRLGDLQSAIEACQEIKMDEVGPGQMAVFAALYFAAGPAMTAEGKEDVFALKLESILRPIPTNAVLLTEETAMLQRVLDGLIQMRSKAAQVR